MSFNSAIAFVDAATLAEAATGADLVIASAGPSAWTAQLARSNIAVLLLRRVAGCGAIFCRSRRILSC